MDLSARFYGRIPSSREAAMQVSPVHSQGCEKTAEKKNNNAVEVDGRHISLQLSLMSPQLCLLDAATVFHDYGKKLFNQIARQAKSLSPFFPPPHHAALAVGIRYRRGLMHF